MKFDGNGNEEWMKILNGKVECIRQTADSGYILSGNNPGVEGDIWLVKTDENGNATPDCPNAGFGAYYFTFLAQGYQNRP